MEAEKKGGKLRAGEVDAKQERTRAEPRVETECVRAKVWSSGVLF